MTILQNYPLYPIVFAPLAGFIVLLVFSARLKEKTIAAYLACTTVLISFVSSLYAFIDIVGKNQGKVLYYDLFKWFSILGFDIKFSLLMDNLSALMAVIVSGVSFLIHIYSLGYMDKDKDKTRFFSYLNLFVFFMLILVLASNPLFMFMGWEGVGLCSYLLIGFWYENIDNAAAGKKAFITNRVGDAFFIVGLLILACFAASKGGSIEFLWMKENMPSIIASNPQALSILSLAAIFMFLGATGKSAQFPLYVWLPDAMAGPTPVSALIHAATMVTAGVYMVSRMFFLYQISPLAMEIILYTASFTSILAAIIACLQSDIKKILAYSTISQLGYMFLGAASGVYQTAIFHLVTHAFFKALLFLAAGSVIHALGGIQDIFKMGGLKDKIKYTFFLTACGWLAICGVPPFSGFYSKDLIIESLWLSRYKWVWAISVFTAALTAYYMTRMFKLVFFGKTGESANHAHESPVSMLWPMVVLAFMSIFSGLLSRNFFSFINFEGMHEHLPFLIVKAPLIAALLGITGGFYLTSERISSYWQNRLPLLRKVILGKFYLDEFYELTFFKPLYSFSQKIIFSFIDRKVVDSFMVEGPAVFFNEFGNIARKTQNGNLSFYALVLVLTAVIAAAYAIRAVL